jgi:hypothetical protein
MQLQACHIRTPQTDRAFGTKARALSVVGAERDGKAGEATPRADDAEHPVRTWLA